jgi:tetratricopeptide (TPR) repeat protein
MGRIKMRRLCYGRLVISALGLGLVVSALSAAAQDRTYMYDGKEITKNQADAIELVNQGKGLLVQGKYKELLESADKAVMLAPDMALSQALYGTALSKVGRLDEAREHLVKALSIDANLPKAWVSLGAVYTSLGNNAEALNCYHTYLKKFPDDSHVALVKSIIDLANKANAPTEPNSCTSPNSSTSPKNPTAANAPAAPDSGDDYFAQACGQDPCRWPADQMPVTVYIAPGKSAQGYRDSYIELVKQACADWSSASKGKVTFRFVGSPENCKIRVMWIDSAAQLINKGAASECKTTHSGDVITAASIKLLTVDPVEKTVSDAKMKNLALNQIGTAIGIIRSSSSPHDAMYFSATTDNQNTVVSDRDAKTIQRLYAGSDKPSYGELNKAATAAMSGGDLPKAVALLTEAHQLYPAIDILTDNLSIALYNSGLKELNATHYEKGIQFFDRALAVKPDYKTAKSDLGVCYLNLGVGAQNSGDNQAALTYYLKAVSRFEDCQNQALLSKTVVNCIGIYKSQGKESEAKSMQSKYSSVLSTK